MYTSSNTTILYLINLNNGGNFRPSSRQNIYKNVNIGVHNVLFIIVMRSHLQSYISL